MPNYQLELYEAEDRPDQLLFPCDRYLLSSRREVSKIHKRIAFSSITHKLKRNSALPEYISETKQICLIVSTSDKGVKMNRTCLILHNRMGEMNSTYPISSVINGRCEMHIVRMCKITARSINTY